MPEGHSAAKAALREFWPLPRGLTFLNHGAFGLTPNTSYTLTGWVNLQYLKLTRNQRPFDVADVPKATEIFRGDIQGAATAVKPPPEAEVPLP